mmetsp:Transcript_9619/g.14245  ORF Transcript_9619/g.14245 Transcript_9619/m.14245 type:complete len:976 (+) Transcript_9619:1160-4087(+)
MPTRTSRKELVLKKAQVTRRPLKKMTPKRPRKNQVNYLTNPNVAEKTKKRERDAAFGITSSGQIRGVARDEKSSLWSLSNLKLLKQLYLEIAMCKILLYHQHKTTTIPTNDETRRSLEQDLNEATTAITDGNVGSAKKPSKKVMQTLMDLDSVNENEMRFSSSLNPEFHADPFKKLFQLVHFIDATRMVMASSSSPQQHLERHSCVEHNSHLIHIIEHNHRLSSFDNDKNDESRFAYIAYYQKTATERQRQHHPRSSGIEVDGTMNTLTQNQSFLHMSPSPANITPPTTATFNTAQSPSPYQQHAFSPTGSGASQLQILPLTPSKTILPTTPITDKIDLHNWTNSLLNLASPEKSVKPSTRLMLYLDSGDEELRKLQRKRHCSAPLKVEWREVIIPVLNRALSRLYLKEEEKCDGQVEENSGVFSAVGSANPSATHSVSRESGELTSHYTRHQQTATADVDVMPRALVVLYYQVLESILYNETARLKSASHPRLVTSAVFHKALLSCSCVCLMKATGIGTGASGNTADLSAVLRAMECTPYEFMKVSESFVKGLQLGSGSSSTANSHHYKIGRVAAFPVALRRHVRGMEENILDSLLWSNPSSKRMDEGNSPRIICIKQVIRDVMSKKGEWPPEVLRPNLQDEAEDEKDYLASTSATTGAPTKRSSSAKAHHHPEYAFLTYILRKILAMVSHRISTLCQYLSIPSQYPVSRQIWIAFRYLLRHNIELLYDRHIDQLLLCTIYGVSKIMKLLPELSFSKIIEVYTTLNKERLGNKACQRIIRHIKLQTNEDCVDGTDGKTLKRKKANKRNGNVIHLYNQIYVPSMKSHLLGSKSLKKAISYLKQCMAEQSARTAIRTVEDAAIMADQVSSHRLGDISSKKSLLPVPTSVKNSFRSDLMPKTGMGSVNPNQSFVRVPGSNMYLTIPASSEMSSSSQCIRRRKRSAADALAPKTRALYKFGDANAKDVLLVNETIKTD